MLCKNFDFSLRQLQETSYDQFWFAYVFCFWITVKPSEVQMLIYLKRIFDVLLNKIHSSSLIFTGF